MNLSSESGIQSPSPVSSLDSHKIAQKLIHTFGDIYKEVHHVHVNLIITQRRGWHTSSVKGQMVKYSHPWFLRGTGSRIPLLIPNSTDARLLCTMARYWH